MATINEYPKLEANNCPYLDSLKLKLIHAKDFTPHKVAYYEQLIQDWIKHTTEINTVKTTIQK